MPTALIPWTLIDGRDEDYCATNAGGSGRRRDAYSTAQQRTARTVDKRRAFEAQDGRPLWCEHLPCLHPQRNWIKYQAAKIVPGTSMSFGAWQFSASKPDGISTDNQK